MPRPTDPRGARRKGHGDHDNPETGPRSQATQRPPSFAMAGRGRRETPQTRAGNGRRRRGPPHRRRRYPRRDRCTAQRRAGFPRGRPAAAGTEPSGRLETRDRLASDGERGEAGRRITLRTVHTGCLGTGRQVGLRLDEDVGRGDAPPGDGRRHRDTDGGVMTVGATRSEATQAPESAERSRVQDRAAHEAPRSGQDAPARGRRDDLIVCRRERVAKARVIRVCEDRASRIRAGNGSLRRSSRKGSP